MKSTEFLQSAMGVQKERGEQYDKPSGERSMGATVRAFNAITGHMLEESDGWMLLGLLKLVRQSQNPEKYHHDSALDFVAYASLYAEAASEQCGQVEAQQESASNLPDGYSWDDAPEFADILIQHLDDGDMYWAKQSTGQCEAIGSAVSACRVSYPSEYFKLLSSRSTSTAK